MSFCFHSCVCACVRKMRYSHIGWRFSPPPLLLLLLVCWSNTLIARTVMLAIHNESNDFSCLHTYTHTPTALLIARSVAARSSHLFLRLVQWNTHQCAHTFRASAASECLSEREASNSRPFAFQPWSRQERWAENKSDTYWKKSNYFQKRADEIESIFISKNYFNIFFSEKICVSCAISTHFIDFHCKCTFLCLR